MSVLDELERLLWAVKKECGSRWKRINYTVQQVNGVHVCTTHHEMKGTFHAPRAEYIATCCPDTIEKLIAVVKVAQAVWDEEQTHLDPAVKINPFSPLGKLGDKLEKLK